MKIIAIEISVEHEPDAQEDAIACEPDAPAQQREVSNFALTREIADAEQTLPHIEALAAELMRRYRTINARKTN